MWWAAAVQYLSKPPQGGTMLQTPTAKAAMGTGAALAVAGAAILVVYLMKNR